MSRTSPMALLLRGTIQVALDKLERVLGSLPLYAQADGLLGVPREDALRILLEEIEARPTVKALVDGSALALVHEAVDALEPPAAQVIQVDPVTGDRIEDRPKPLARERKVSP